jgi:outer membrane protein
MQKNMTKIVLFATFFCFSGLNSANAAAPVASATSNVKSGVQIGVIDSQIIMTSDVTKAVQTELANLQAELEADVKSQDTNLEKLYKEIQAAEKLANDSALDKKREAFNDAKNKRDLAAKLAGEKMQRAANKAMEQLTKLVQDAAQQVLQDLGLDLILDKGATLAYSKSIDVTDKLIAKIKTMQGSSSKTTPAAKTPAPAKK